MFCWACPHTKNDPAFLQENRSKRTFTWIGHATALLQLDGVNILKMRNVYELRRRIGVVFPLPVGLPLSIYDNVAFGPRIAGRPRDRQDEIAARWLHRVGLDGFGDRAVTDLSGGEAKRVALARTLAAELALEGERSACTLAREWADGPTSPTPPPGPRSTASPAPAMAVPTMATMTIMSGAMENSPGWSAAEPWGLTDRKKLSPEGAA